VSRVRAEALALVNWKGVFYERYLLDENVTALEGANGAGKTTVMIAAYLVLLPDMTRLRFTNLGESAATGGDKGIYGRLGQPDGPSYAAIDFRLGSGERLLAGVHLQRRSEPTLELTPFVVSGLDDNVVLQDILLDRGEVDAIPDLNRFRELVTLGAGRIKTYHKKHGDYFSELFDQGVTPLRLAAGEERTKLNEMLRTSMVGGISRALTGGLRDFLLKAETGLADTLKRMRSNLDTCRRTRLEVEAAQRMEGEIHCVFEVGQEMFVAAVFATRARAGELRQQLDRAEAALDKAEARERELKGAHASKVEEHRAAQNELSQVRAALEQAQQTLDRVRAANTIARRIASRQAERVDLARVLVERNATSDRRREDRDRARIRLDEAHHGLEQAAKGLANFQEGLDELHRRAAAFDQVTRRLEQAQLALAEEVVEPDAVAPLRMRCERQVGDLDTLLARLDLEIGTTLSRGAESDRVLKALHALSGSIHGPEAALNAAQGVLRQLRDMESLAGELSDLPARIEQARQLASRQHRARDAARRLFTAEGVIESSRAVNDAFGKADEVLQACREELGSAQASLSKATAARLDAQAEVEEFERILPAWRDARGRAEQLGEVVDEPVTTRADLEALHRQLTSDGDRLRDHLKEVKRRIEELRDQADQLEHSGGRFSPELLHARDEVDGELLAGHFDDVGLEEAAPLEALLGPLSESIVVEDAEQAAHVLAGLPGRPPHLWLVDQAPSLSMEELGGDAQRTEDSVVVPTSHATRLSRIPEQPTLGRRARAACIRELRQEIEQGEDEQSKITAGLRGVQQALATAGDLLADVALLERPDPQEELREARQRLETSAAAERRVDARLPGLERNLEDASTRRSALQSLIPDAHLLDPPDHAAALETLEARLASAKRADKKLNDAAVDRARLADGLDVLRRPPPSAAEIQGLEAKLCAERARRDRIWGALEALRYVEGNLAALGWSDAPGALSEKAALRPVLDEQLRLAKAEVKYAKEAEARTAAAYERAAEDAQKAQAALDQLDAALDRDREELEGTGVEDPSDEALARAERRRQDLDRTFSEQNEHERKLMAEVEGARVRHETQVTVVEELKDARDREEARWHPAEDRWKRLQAEAEEAGILASALTPADGSAPSAVGSANLFQEARSKGELLVDRLARSEGGKEYTSGIRRWFKEASRDDFGLAYLRAWLEARQWLRLRVPPQIAEVDDPLEALSRVRDHLERLRGQLAQQERNLRGQAGDVARNIETQRRKARREVGRLNQELSRVHFGSIRGVQIQVRPVESRERVLRALREDTAQQLLFQSDMPLDEAMAELFKKYGGGKTGGQKLLDYREYLDLQVEVRRQASERWERANPTRMSTGEAIGVGAAIMMVVLTAWERHANLLRARRAHGTLRLLFLDEANRLSQDNLGVLFELCQSLELQLLIAAPEVAHAEGNTTYHLVRQLDDAGQEVVRAAGRRTMPKGQPDVE